MLSKVRVLSEQLICSHCACLRVTQGFLAWLPSVFFDLQVKMERTKFIEEESEEHEDPILISTDCKITLRPLISFGTTISRGCRKIAFVQGIHGLKLINPAFGKI